MPATATRWTRLRESFSHAFAVRRDPLTQDQLAILDRLADEIRRRRLVPAVAAAAELARPVAGVTGHSVSFFEPLLSSFVDPQKIDTARQLLQHPDAIDALQERLGEEQGARNEARAGEVAQ